MHRMHNREWIVTSLAGLASLGCQPAEGWQGPDSVDLGISADLHAVAWVSRAPDSDGYLAVGAAGAVVLWEAYPRWNERRLVRARSVGDADLRALGFLGDGWLVVGDRGTAAHSLDEGLTWTILELGVDADLHAVFSVQGRTMILGDEVVLLEQEDGSLAELAPPEVGWGLLRDGINHGQTYLVGHDGVVWSSSDALEPSVPWIAEPTGTSMNLLAVGPSLWDVEWDALSVAAVGEGGTLLLRNVYDGWMQLDTYTSVDFVDYENSTVLTAEGELIRIATPGELTSWDLVPGARGLASLPDGLGFAVVGSAGLAAEWIFIERY